MRVPMTIAQATAYTILSTESLLAYQNHVPSTGLAARQEEGLRALSRLLMSMESIVASQEVKLEALLTARHSYLTLTSIGQALRNYALHLLRMALSSESPVSILELDAFGLMVGLFSTLPSLIESPNESETRGVPQFNPILV